MFGKESSAPRLKNLYAKHRGQKPGIKIADAFTQHHSFIEIMFLFDDYYGP